MGLPNVTSQPSSLVNPRLGSCGDGQKSVVIAECGRLCSIRYMHSMLSKAFSSKLPLDRPSATVCRLLVDRRCCFQAAGNNVYIASFHHSQSYREYGDVAGTTLISGVRWCGPNVQEVTETRCVGTLLLRGDRIQSHSHLLADNHTVGYGCNADMN